MPHPAKPVNTPSNSQASHKSFTRSEIPNGLTSEQVIAAIAWAWINEPNMVYQGLKVAFNLAPTDNQQVQ